MKQKLRFMILTLLCAVFCSVWGQETVTITDFLDSELIGVYKTKYQNWNNKKCNSYAEYTGNSACYNASIQLRSTNNSGIITTQSGGKVKSITIEWDSNTVDGRELEVYGKNEPYSATSDLYESNSDSDENPDPDIDDQSDPDPEGNIDTNPSVKGTLIGTIVKGKTTSLTITDDYEYIGLRSANKAMYIKCITIEWETANPPQKVYTPRFTPVSGTSSNGVLEISISCATEDAEIYFSTNKDDPKESYITYITSISITENTIIKAYAKKDGLEDSEIATAIYYISDVLVENNVFDFTYNLDYESGLTPSSNNNQYIEGSNTWISGDVTLVTDGKYRYWQRSKGNQLRIGYDNHSILTFSVPESNVITQIEFDAGPFHLTPDVGTLTDKTWEGKSNTVVFTATELTELNKIIVSFEEGVAVSSDPLLSIEDVYLYGNTAPLELSSRSNGEVTFSYDPENVIEINYNEELNQYIVTCCEGVDEGSTIVRAVQEPTDTYNGSSVEFNVTVDKKSFWSLTDLDNLTPDDVFVIVGTIGTNEDVDDEDASEVSYAMSNDKGTSYAPKAIEVTVSDDKMKLTSTVRNNMKWTIEKTDEDSYIFHPQGNQELSLYTFNNNDGMRVGGGDSDNSYILEDNYLYNNSKERYVGIYHSQEWRCYKIKDEPSNIANQTIAFYKIFKPEDIEVTFAKRAEGYSTLYYGEKNLVIPEGVKAYTYKVDEHGKAVETAYENVIPKGSAVIVELEDKSLLAEQNYKASFATTTASETPHSDNMLYGFDEDGQETVGPDESKKYLFYSLSLNKNQEEGSIGFYWYQTDGSKFSMPAHRAYLAVEKTEATQNVSVFSFDGMGTGINGIVANSLPVDGIYTLMGVRVNSEHLHKGIYIVNGKKLIIK